MKERGFLNKGTRVLLPSGEQHPPFHATRLPEIPVNPLLFSATLAGTG